MAVTVYRYVSRYIYGVKPLIQVVHDEYTIYASLIYGEIIRPMY